MTTTPAATADTAATPADPCLQGPTTQRGAPTPQPTPSPRPLSPARGPPPSQAVAQRVAYPPQEVSKQLNVEAPTDVEYDAVIVGGGMGGLATASQLVAKGAKVLVLEK